MNTIAPPLIKLKRSKIFMAAVLATIRKEEKKLTASQPETRAAKPAAQLGFLVYKILLIDIKYQEIPK